MIIHDCMLQNPPPCYSKLMMISYHTSTQKLNINMFLLSDHFHPLLWGWRSINYWPPWWFIHIHKLSPQSWFFSHFPMISPWRNHGSSPHFPHIFPRCSQFQAVETPKIFHRNPAFWHPHGLRAILQLQAAAGAASHPTPGLARVGRWTEIQWQEKWQEKWQNMGKNGKIWE